MINFHQEIAHQFVDAVEQDSVEEAKHLLNALVLDAQVTLPPHNCGQFCNESCISYNYAEHTEEALAEFRDLLVKIHNGSHGDIYGVLVPRFFCLASQWLQSQEETVDDGELGSEPIE